jgi:hypothetical protein
MNEPKPFASLGPTLLARKGGARPAMRPQIAPITAMAPAQSLDGFEPDLEDLGWNDMGEDQEEPRHSSVLALTPASASSASDYANDEDEDGAEDAGYEAEPAEPEVHRQQRAIIETIAPEPAFEAALVALPEPTPVPVARTRAPRRSAADDGRRAAFTLRLDGARHLKLRLASTVMNRSAQALVTQALDKFLAEMPELEALTAQLQRD